MSMHMPLSTHMRALRSVHLLTHMSVHRIDEDPVVVVDLSVRASDAALLIKSTLGVDASLINDFPMASFTLQFSTEKLHPETYPQFCPPENVQAKTIVTEGCTYAP